MTSINQPLSYSTDQSINRSISQSVSQSVGKSIDQSMGYSSIGQSGSQSMKDRWQTQRPASTIGSQCCRAVPSLLEFAGTVLELADAAMPVSWPCWRNVLQARKQAGISVQYEKMVKKVGTGSLRKGKTLTARPLQFRPPADLAHSIRPPRQDGNTGGLDTLSLVVKVLLQCNKRQLYPPTSCSGPSITKLSYGLDNCWVGFSWSLLSGFDWVGTVC